MTKLGDGLHRLFDIEARLERVTRSLTAKPAELHNDQLKVDKVKGRLKEADDALKAHDLKVRALEKDLKQAEADLERSKVAQNSASNNDEYQAHQRKIDSLSEVISKHETDILELYEGREAFDKALKTAQTNVKTAESIYAEAKARIDGEVSTLEKQLAEVQKEREDALAALESDDRNKYLRAYQKHGTKTLAKLRGGVCQGCYMPVRANEVIKVELAKEIMFCKECGKIMIWGD